MGRYWRPGGEMRLHATTACRRGFLLQLANFRRRRGAYYAPGVIARHRAGGALASFAKRRLGAIRQAARLGLLTVQERRREGQKNLPNVIRVVSREWLQWLRIGYRKIDPTAKGGAASPRRDFRNEGGARSRPPDGAGEVRPA